MYLTKIINPTTPQQMFDGLTAAIAAMGWQLHDPLSGSDAVYKTNGEDGRFNYVYVRFYTSPYGVIVRSYLYWDAASHEGAGGEPLYMEIDYGTVAANGFYANSGPFHISGDKDFVYCDTPWQSEVSATKGAYRGGFGFLSIIGPNAVYTIAEAISAGDNVTVLLEEDIGADLRKNAPYMICGALGEGRDWGIHVIEITGAKTCVIQNIPRNYAAGAKIGDWPHCFVNSVQTRNADRWYPLSPRGLNGLAMNASRDTNYFLTASPLPIANCDPAFFSDRWIIPYPVFYEGATAEANPGAVGILKWHIGVASEVTPLDTIVMSDFNGVWVATGGGGAYTVACAGSGWQVDEFAGRIICFSEGDAAGQTRYIQSNTADTITVSVAFSPVPNVDAVFKIGANAWRRNRLFWMKEIIR